MSKKRFCIDAKKTQIWRRRGRGNKCPKCTSTMERRERTTAPDDPTRYWYTEWDVCRQCRHVQHYDGFKMQPLAPKVGRRGSRDWIRHHGL